MVEIGNIGKSGRVEIRRKTFGNYFVLETSVDEINVTTEPSTVLVKMWVAKQNAKLLEMEGRG